MGAFVAMLGGAVSTALWTEALAGHPPVLASLLILTLLSGFAVLAWSADEFVEGASTLALHAHVPAITIGIVVVGFGTSAPEMLVSAFAAWNGDFPLAVGNAFGSNIANVGLIVGACALIGVVVVPRTSLRVDVPLLLLISAVSTALLWDGFADRTDGALLIGLLVMALIIGLWAAKRNHEPTEAPSEPLTRALIGLVVGIGLLLVSAHVLVNAAVELSRMIGLSEFVIGLTVVAIGTSLPELAASLSAVRRGQPQIAVGNVIGSNMFNLSAVIGIAALTRPSGVDRADVVEGSVMAAVFLLVFLGASMAGKIQRRSRSVALGVLLLTGYVAYVGWLAVTRIGVA